MPLIKSLKINWLSPSQIEKLSEGEVTNSKTLNPKTLKPELGGLFDPRIFGPFLSYECYCGKYRGEENAGQKCERCEVLITSKNAQRHRRGHASLAVPVTNIILFNALKTNLSDLLGIPSKNLEEIIYLKTYVVLDNGSSKLLRKKQILGKQVDPRLMNNLLQEIIQNPRLTKEAAIQGRQLVEDLVEEKEKDTVFLEDYLEFLEKFGQIKIWTGSEAFESLLKGINLNQELEILKKGEMNQKQSERKRFLQALQNNKIKLEWMVMHKLPVIPCGLRPIVKLKGEDKIAASQDDELYRVTISANKRLKECLIRRELLYPEIIHNEKRRLQISVDQLLYKSPHQGSETSKSISQKLSGKEGILRRHSLGKRVDYSARSVIVPNPSLQIDQIGLPLKMILGLFRPFIIQKICQKRDIYASEAEQILNEGDSLVFSILNEVIQDHPVLINRAPSLHRLSIQGFYPKIAAGNSIELHPLVTTALNADFDGDQVAIHLPITKKAQNEIKEKVLSPHHIIDPKNGHLIALPTQDMILGIYYLTKENKPEKRIYFDQMDSIQKSYEQGRISLNELIMVPACLGRRNFVNVKNKFLFTTLGKLIFNQILPISFPFYLSDLREDRKNQLIEFEKSWVAEINEIEKKWISYQPLGGWKKKDLINFLNQLVRETPYSEIVKFLDQLKKLSFDYAAQSGISISPFELAEIVDKTPALKKTYQEIEQIDQEYTEGYHNEKEDKEKRIVAWENCKETLQKKLISSLEKKTATSFYQIWDSGARISTESLVQLFAMRGHATNYLGEIIQTPIISSLWEGLSPLEFFISVYGTIKGMVDIALKTAEAGDLTRRLVESSQHLIILTEDCKTTQGIWLKEKDETLLAQKVYGRYLAQDFMNLKPNTLLLKDEINLIQNHKITSLFVRSPLKCELVNGICQKCYGTDLSKPGEVIKIGTAVGIIAAQSLGEPGTQLTMRTFHAGKVSGEEDITQGLPKVKQILDNLKTTKENEAILAQEDGIIEKIDLSSQLILQKVGEESKTYSWKGKKMVLVISGETVKKGQPLTSGVVGLENYLEVMGRDSCQDYIKNEVSKVYQQQGIEINDKHIEIFARQLLSRVKITVEGDSEHLPGKIVNYQKIQKENQSLISQGKKTATFQSTISSLKDLASRPPSFLAGISFQNTLKSLVNYSLYQPVDYLTGSKESLIAGQLVPVGSGFEERKKILLKRLLDE
ncbi:MAG: DNA-directed RNA polymerase subunit beta' [Mycoplasmataceae bacterium RC_NB112A]|nr:MAG: DNA-directed RNA polymerase subunit beta' [Mycoplasmataceae bacterium RC_NB112A]KLL01879.1 MAG: DNA-directed RNA polymerase subunit beta' [Mycoplasmataceae bacterium RC_NB112A]